LTQTGEGSITLVWQGRAGSRHDGGYNYKVMKPINCTRNGNCVKLAKNTTLEDL